MRIDIAQAIWQTYAAETGRALPPGLADKLADSVIESMNLTEQRRVHVPWSCSPVSIKLTANGGDEVTKDEHRWVTDWIDNAP